MSEKRGEDNNEAVCPGERNELCGTHGMSASAGDDQTLFLPVMSGRVTSHPNLVT